MVIDSALKQYSFIFPGFMKTFTETRSEVLQQWDQQDLDNIEGSRFLSTMFKGLFQI